MEEDFRNTEQEYVSLTSGLNIVNLELERSYGDLRNAENAVKRADDSVESIIKNSAKRESDLSSTLQEMVQLQLSSKKINRT